MCLLLLDQVRWNSKFVCWKYVIFSSQNQTQTTKIMPTYSSSWNFSQVSMRCKLDNWGRREGKISDKAFFVSELLWYQSGCCTCGNISEYYNLTCHWKNLAEPHWKSLTDFHLLYEFWKFICITWVHIVSKS